MIIVLCNKKEIGLPKMYAIRNHWYANRLPKNLITNLDVCVIYKEFNLFYQSTSVTPRSLVYATFHQFAQPSLLMTICVYPIFFSNKLAYAM